MAKRSPEITSRIMSKIKSTDTKVEIQLEEQLNLLHIPFEKQYKISGRPDFIIKGTKIAIFCDGDFWHGNNWKIRGLNSQKEEFSKLSEFWVSKIKNNMKRDRKVNKLLDKSGWIVLRFWESDIKKDSTKIAKVIHAAYNNYLEQSEITKSNH